MRPRIGLLPLYIALYDRVAAASRPRMERFYAEIAAALERQGLDVRRAPVCRLRPEFERAVRAFERAGADALVTLHLAYSPSLESAAALAATPLPLIVLDTTPAFQFGPGQGPDEVMFNHGIHGVQDMCNLLLRNGKPFAIEAGHWQRSDVFRRVAAHARGAVAARAMRRARVGLIGRPFAGMGDFAVPFPVLRRTIGLTVVRAQPARFRAILGRLTPREVEAEAADSRRRFRVRRQDAAALRLTSRAALAVRRWAEAERLTAFTFNFLESGPGAGLPTEPFLEASKAMARGMGYAGEGDVLTAALVGALAAAYPDTTFTEMFCPDWRGDRVFLSHMGEVNVNLLAEARPRLSERTFSWPEGKRPLAAVGCLRAGPAVFVNLAPLGGGRYRLILAPGAMVAGGRNDRFMASVHGWFRPAQPVAPFLAAYSRAGGTHHAALVYGKETETLRTLGHFMGWETVTIG
jgi:L-arabinose isomerase